MKTILVLFRSPLCGSMAAFLVLVALLSDLGSLTAFAGIVSSAGVTVLTAPPSGDVKPGTQQPTPVPIVFPEVLSGVVPAGGVPVDHDGSLLSPTLVESASIVNPSLNSAVLPAGTRFDSYLIHFDPADFIFPSASNFYSGVSVAFSSPIIGVQVFGSGFTGLQKPAGSPYVGALEAGDAVIAANGGPPLTYYPTGDVSRGLEEDGMGVDLGGKEILLVGKAFGTEIDQVRVFVAVVPESSRNDIVAGLCLLLLIAITRLR